MPLPLNPPANRNAVSLADENGARPLQSSGGESSVSSSVICGTTMLETITNTSKELQHGVVVGGSLATALRDRQAYVIPMQPNRSLPVRPAPQHPPSRGSIVKTSLVSRPKSTISSSLIREAESLIPLPEVPSAKPPEEEEMKRSEEIQNVVTTSEMIDISRSPERIDLSDEISICPSGLDSSSPGCWVHGLVAKEPNKRKRRRRTKKPDAEENIETGGMEKTVPPLRLKKIQTLQEPHIVLAGPAWPTFGRDTSSDPGLINPDSSFDANLGMRNKYRIVTGNTPPNGERTDPTIELRLDSLDAAKLRYRRTKLKLKLRELRLKTMELGKEMLRSVFTTPVGPKGSKMRQTMTRYEGQIRHFQKLLDELPRVEQEDTQPGWNYQEQGMTQEIFSPARNICSSNSSSPSLEPPKLSPKSPTNYAAARSPSDVRNSPPVLPRVYITIADNVDDGYEKYSRRGRAKRSNRSPLVDTLEANDTATAANISDTTTDTIVEDKVQLVLESNDFMEKPLPIITKSDLEVLDVYDENEEREAHVIVETRKQPLALENTPDVKPTIKNSTAPIDNSSVDNFEPKPLILTENSEIPNKGKCSNSTSCDVLDKLLRTDMKDDVKNGADKNITETQNSVNCRSISEQFPSLGNWIARLSKKQAVQVEANKKITEAPTITDRNTTLQQVFNSEIVKPVGPKVSRGPAPRPAIAEAVNVVPQWRADRWQEQGSQQPQAMPQSYGPTLAAPPAAQPPPQAQPLPPPPPPSALSQDFCSPIAMARLYARNYALDPYSMAYGYNPAIAAAAATASLWNSAAILQYPLMRPSSTLLSSQQARVSGSLQFPGSPQSMQRPNYRVSGMPQQGDSKGPENSVNYPREGKILPSGYPTSFEQTKRATAEYHRAVAAGAQNRGISYNPANGQTNYRNCLPGQQTQEQQQFARNYPENAMRLPVNGGPWRAGHVLGAMANNYNYGTTWNSAPTGNILNSAGRTATPDFVAAPTLSMNSSRTRNTKESADFNVRNCDTPHLGKVNYSPNQTNKLECSNCGLSGTLFKCLGCEVAFYCDENCQTRHWSRHVVSCPKKMPKLKKLVH